MPFGDEINHLAVKICLCILQVNNIGCSPLGTWAWLPTSPQTHWPILVAKAEETMRKRREERKSTKTNASPVGRHWFSLCFAGRTPWTCLMVYCKQNPFPSWPMVHSNDISFGGCSVQALGGTVQAGFVFKWST